MKINKFKTTISGQKRTFALSSILHKLSQSRWTGLERGNSDQGLPAWGVRHQVHGGHLGVLEDGERGGQVWRLHPGLDEADPGAPAWEWTAQTGNWWCWSSGMIVLQDCEALMYSFDVKN